jgi:ribosome-binding factor A
MTGKRYPRTSRVNELLREIIADELERQDDERLEFVTVAGVEVDAGLEHAAVYFSTLGDPDDDPGVVEALESVRTRLQRAVGQQARLHNIPRLEFRPDPGIRTGERIEEIIRDLHRAGGVGDEDGEREDSGHEDSGHSDSEPDDGEHSDEE